MIKINRDSLAVYSAKQDGNDKFITDIPKSEKDSDKRPVTTDVKEWKDLVTRIDHTIGTPGGYTLNISKMNPKQSVYIKLTGTIQNEYFDDIKTNDANKHKLKVEFYERGFQLGNSMEKTIAKSNYGSNLETQFAPNRLMKEVHHYELDNSDSSKNGRLYLGEKFTADGKVGDPVGKQNGTDKNSQPDYDGVILPVYKGHNKAFHGKNILISGENNRIYLGITSSFESPTIWTTSWLNLGLESAGGNIDPTAKWDIGKQGTADQLMIIDLKSTPAKNEDDRYWDNTFKDFDKEYEKMIKSKIQVQTQTMKNINFGLM